jgi:hypothetical protein
VRARAVQGVAVAAIEIDHAGKSVGIVRGKKTQLLSRDRVADQHGSFERERVEHLEHVGAQPVDAVAPRGRT